MLARVRRANAGTLTTPTASMALNEPGPSTAMITIASRIAGTARRKSSTRMIATSGSPPANPPRRPSGTPTVAPMSTATRPVRSEMRAPWITRLRMSRPNSSVPKGWARDGEPEPLRAALGQGILRGDPWSQDSDDGQHRQHDTRGEPGAVPSGPWKDEPPWPAAIYLAGSEACKPVPGRSRELARDGARRSGESRGTDVALTSAAGSGRAEPRGGICSALRPERSADGARITGRWSPGTPTGDS